jgi:hypothetical protein
LRLHQSTRRDSRKRYCGFAGLAHFRNCIFKTLRRVADGISWPISPQVVSRGGQCRSGPSVDIRTPMHRNQAPAFGGCSRLAGLERKRPPMGRAETRPPRKVPCWLLARAIQPGLRSLGSRSQMRCCLAAAIKASVPPGPSRSTTPASASRVTAAFSKIGAACST